MSGYVTNPRTGKQVLATGKIGRAILAQAPPRVARGPAGPPAISAPPRPRGAPTLIGAGARPKGRLAAARAEPKAGVRFALDELMAQDPLYRRRTADEQRARYEATRAAAFEDDDDDEGEELKSEDDEDDED